MGVGPVFMAQTRRKTMTPARMSCRQRLSADNRENRNTGGNIQLT